MLYFKLIIMSITPTSIALLDKVISGFQLPSPAQQNVLIQVYDYLFIHPEKEILLDPEPLHDSVLTLREIVTSRRFATVEDLYDFFETEKKGMRDVLGSLMPGSKQRHKGEQKGSDRETAFLNEIHKIFPRLHMMFFQKIQTLKIDKHAYVADLIQETMLRAWLKYQRDTKLDSYLTLLIWESAKDVLHSFIKERKDRPSDLERTMELEGGPDPQELLRHMESNAWDLCNQLDELLHMGYSYAELESAFNLPGDIESKMHRYRKKLE